jgi:hypothetical protein
MPNYHRRSIFIVCGFWGRDIRVFTRSKADMRLRRYDNCVLKVINPVNLFTCNCSGTFIIQEDNNNYIFVGNYEIYRFKPIDDITRCIIHVFSASSFTPCAVDVDGNKYFMYEKVYFKNPACQQAFDYELIYRGEEF